MTKLLTVLFIDFNKTTKRFKLNDRKTRKYLIKCHMFKKKLSWIEVNLLIQMTKYF